MGITNDRVQSKQMGRYKFLVSGPVGAGKTSAIDAVSDSDIFHTDVKVSDTAGFRKEKTTVAMDYGTIVMENGKKAHVYGTPGQERFDFMWEVLANGTQGLLLLFDNSRNYPQRDLAYYLNAFSRLVAEVPLVIGITRMDIKSDPPLERYQQWLKEVRIEGVPIVRVDAREKEDVRKALEILAEQVEARAPVTQAQTSSVKATVQTETSQTAQPTPLTSSPPQQPSSAAAPTISPPPNITSNALETHSLQFSDSSLERIQRLQGVTGLVLSDEMGEVLHSSIEDEQITDFSAFLASMTPMIEEALAMGNINRVTVKSPREDSLSFFIEAEQSLTISSHRRTSIPVLTQQVEDVLQWG